MNEITTRTAIAFNNQIARVIPQVDAIQLKNVRLILDTFNIHPQLFRRGERQRTHSHRETQYQIILNGKFEFNTANQKNILQPHEVFITAPHVEHSWCCLEKGRLLGGKIFVGGEDRTKFLDHLRANVDGGYLKIKLSYYNDIIQFLFDGMMPGKYINSEVIPHMLYMIMWGMIVSVPGIKVFRNEDAPYDPSKSRHFSIIEEAKNFINDNISKNLSVSDLSKHVHVGERQLNRIFRELEDIPIHRFILQHRLKMVKKLITEDPHCSIKTIAYESGFSSAAHLSQRFKKEFDIRPSEFRKHVITRGSRA